MGFPIRKSSDQSLFAAPQGLSQRTTSFIASDRQGIHQTPFLRLIRSRRQTTHEVGRYLDRCLVCLPVHSSKPGYERPGFLTDKTFGQSVKTLEDR